MNRARASAVLAAVLAGAGCHVGTTSSAPACATSIADWCRGSQASACSWSIYSDPTKFDCAHTSLAACGPYDVATWHGVDTGEVRYYEASTGRLLAVVDYTANGGGSRACVAGPPSGFVEPDCAASAFTGSCPGGRVCSPDAAGCMTNGDCCSGSCVTQGGGAQVCCPASGCP